MATREQLAIVLDSARGWTAVPMTLTGSNHLFYAFHSVYTEYTRELLINPRATPSGVLTNPRATPSGVLTHSLVYSVYTPGRHRITIT